MSENEGKVGGIKQFFIPLLVLLSIGLAFFSGTLWQKVQNAEKVTDTAAEDTTAGETTASVTLDTIKGLFDQDVVKIGDKNSKLTFVEIADPSCPYCHVADGNNPELAADVGDNFKYVSEGGTYVPPGTEIEKLVKDGKASYIYIYYPGHGNGELGMKAMYCAAEQGKFWDVKKLLMSNSGYTLMNTTVQNDVAKAGTVAEFLKSAIDYNFMKSCLESDKYNARLENDQVLAAELAIQGTPSFYVNETNFPGAYSYTDMEEVVNSILD